jgi:S-DNA-T family DNA segregation ATPase FtsK/SpoIIIE
VMTMQLRTNLGNKLILRLGDEGSSKIALNERGAERLLGKGHLIAKLQSDEKVYLQVPYIGDEEVEELAAAVIATWQAPPPRVA